jgi:hypothetical protein
MKNSLAEQAHFVNILPPVDITGGVYSDIFSMAKYDHATILVQIGVSNAAFTKIIVNACDDFTPSSRTALAYNIYKCETGSTAANGDVLGGRTAVLAAGLTPSATDNIMYVIEINAEELPSGKPNLELNLTNGSNSVIASAVAVLTKGRYTGDQSATVTA